jgi:hypothetical protein
MLVRRGGGIVRFGDVVSVGGVASVGSGGDAGGALEREGSPAWRGIGELEELIVMGLQMGLRRLPLPAQNRGLPP